MDYKQITPQYLIDHNINPEGLIFGSGFLPYNPKLKDYSRQMRVYGEKSEAILWKYLKAKGVGFAFNRQKPILNYIADFYCKELEVVVEIDGAAHFASDAQKKDEERDRQMKVLGLRVIRVMDEDVRRNPERVAWYIEEQLRTI